MKKILICVLALILCIGCFASCAKDDDKKTPGTSDTGTTEQNGLDAAKAYVRALYKDMEEYTADDFVLTNVVVINGVSYSVEWSVEITSGPEDGVKIVAGDKEGEIKIDVNDKSAAEVVYTLKAVIKDTAGATTEITFAHKVPAYAVNTYEEYLAACGATKDEDKKKVIVIQGYVIAINSATDSSSKGSMWIQDKDGHGYYAYKPTLSDEELASRESIQAAYPVGTKVEVKGTVTTYSGCLEFNGGCSVTKLGTTAEKDGVTLTYTDATEAFGTAANNKDAAKLNVYQNARVTLKGVVLTSKSADGKYYYFTVNGVQYNLYRSNYYFGDAQIEELFAKFEEGKKADITGVVTVYSGSFQIYPDTVDSIRESDVPLTEAEKIDLELGKVALGDMITSNTEITLPAEGNPNTDVKFVWTLEETTNATYDATTGKLTVTVPDTDAEIKVKVKVTCGAASKEAEYTIKLSKKATPIKELIEIGKQQESGKYTETMYIATGIVTQVIKEQYGNLEIRDAAGNTITTYGIVGYSGLEVKPVAGDLITIIGKVGQYKGTPQFDSNTTTLLSCVKPTTIPGALEIGAGITADTTEKYLVTGTVKEIASDKYGNIYIEDAEGNSIYVYGVYSEDGSVRYDAMEVKPAVGDMVTVYGVLSTYKGTPQLKSAWLMAHDVKEEEVQKPAFDGTKATYDFTGATGKGTAVTEADAALKLVNDSCTTATSPLTAVTMTKVYDGNGSGGAKNGQSGMLKFGTSSANGSMTLNFGDKKVTKVEIKCHDFQKKSEQYPTTKTTIAVNGGEAQAVPYNETAEAAVVTFELAEGASEITINASGRLVIYEIVVYFAE